MNWKLTLSMFFIFLTACSPGSTMQESPTIDPDATSTTSLPAITATELSVPAMTTTVMPTSTPIQQSVPGIMSYTLLQGRVDQWINDRILFTESDRFLDERTEHALKLGVLVKQPINMVIFIFYNLGYTLVENNNGEVYVINVVGFEDGNGQKFTFPFHVGALSDTCAIIHLEKLQGMRINHGEKISFDQLTPSDLLQKVDDIINRANVGITLSDGGGQTGNECVNKNDTFYISAKETTRALTAFLECEECSVVEIPYHIANWVNTVPTEFDPRIPYLRFYDVLY